MRGAWWVRERQGFDRLSPDGDGLLERAEKPGATDALTAR
jgi:hypothetical protein